MGANLQLSPEEIRLVTDPAWILTKNSVMGKVVALMAGLSEDYKEIWGKRPAGEIAAAHGAMPVQGVDGCLHADDRSLIEAAFTAGPKISRGENYRGLPWVML